jgi:hypothetical protein
LKDFYVLTSFAPRAACGPRFLDRYADACRAAAPLVEFVTRAMRLKW